MRGMPVPASLRPRSHGRFGRQILYFLYCNWQANLRRSSAARKSMGFAPCLLPMVCVRLG
jgi:hypothetical protein